MTRKFIWVLCNFVIVSVFLIQKMPVNDYVASMLITLLIYVVPGLAWAGWLKGRVSDWVGLLFYIFVFSSVSMILLHGLQLLVGIPIVPVRFLSVIVIFVNLGLVLTSPHKIWSDVKVNVPKVCILGMSVICIYSCVYTGMKTLPEMMDLDGEHQGTAYGIMHELKPYLTSDIILSPYYFAHPPLSNIYNAYSTFFLGKLDDYKFYYESALKTEDVLNLKKGESVAIELRGVKHKVSHFDRHHYVLQSMNLNDVDMSVQSPEMLVKRISEVDQSRFLSWPRVFPARASNLFASVLVFLVLFQLIATTAQSKLLGIVGGFVYIFSPGIFVRSCFSEHVAFTNAILAVLAYQVFRPEAFTSRDGRHGWLKWLPGVVAGLINQKIVIFMVPVFAFGVLKHISKKDKSSDAFDLARMVPIVGGFAMGTLAFWLYGFVIDGQAFLQSHVYSHLFDRIFHRNTMFDGDYPTVLRLWKEFALEFPLVFLCAFAVLCNLKNIIKDNSMILLLWIIFGGISFSIVDWKQTNHLMLIVLPLIVLLMHYIERQNMTYKRVLKVCVGLCLVYSFYVDLRIMDNFLYYVPTSSW